MLMVQQKTTTHKGRQFLSNPFEEEPPREVLRQSPKYGGDNLEPTAVVHDDSGAKYIVEARESVAANVSTCDGTSSAKWVRQSGRA